MSRGSACTRCRKVCSMRLAKRARVGEPEPARELRRRQPARQLDQRERVAARPRRGSDPARARRSAPAAPRPAAARASLGAQALDSELRQPVELLLAAGLAHREHQPDALRQQPARRRTRASARRPGRATARRRRCTRAAAPRRRRPAGSGPPTRRGSDPAGVRRSGRTPCSARPAAGPADAPMPAEHRRAQRVQAGERELHLRLDARRAGDPASRPRSPPDSPAGRSCRRPPRRAAPAPGSDPLAPRPRADPAPHTHSHDRAGPTTGVRRGSFASRIIATRLAPLGVGASWSSGAGIRARGTPRVPGGERCSPLRTRTSRSPSSPRAAHPPGHV